MDIAGICRVDILKQQFILSAQISQSNLECARPLPDGALKVVMRDAEGRQGCSSQTLGFCRALARKCITRRVFEHCPKTGAAYLRCSCHLTSEPATTSRTPEIPAIFRRRARRAG